MIPWVRLLAYCAGLGALIGLGWYLGARHVQSRWNVERLAQAQAIAAQLAKNASSEHAQQIANEGIINALHTQIADSDARGSDLAHRLRAYQLRACPVPTVAGIPGTAPTSGKPGGTGEVEQAIGVLAAACERDSARLNALSAEIKPQL